MTNQPLSDWIRSEEAQGYSEQQLRDYLVKQGYSSKDIEEAFKSLKKRPDQKSFFKEIFKPTPLKLFLPVLVLILLLISFFVNLTYLPEFGKLGCNFSMSQDEFLNFSKMFNEKINENNLDPEEAVPLIQKMYENNLRYDTEKYISLYKNLLYANFYMAISGLYNLNPFFPTPCEISFMGEDFLSLNCRYYISQESYSCIHGFIEKQASGGGLALLYPDSPHYKKINFFLFLIHSMILFFIIYFFVSILSYISLKFSEKIIKNRTILCILLILILIAIFTFLSSKTYLSYLFKQPFFKISDFTPLLTYGLLLFSIIFISLTLLSFYTILKISEKQVKNNIIIYIILISISILLSPKHYYVFFKNDSFYLFVLFLMFVVFIISLFIKDEKHNKSFLYAMSFILLLLLVSGIFVVNFIVDENSKIDGSMPSKNRYEYNILKCENTTILSMEEKLDRSIEGEYLNQTWNICYDPHCRQICYDYCEIREFFRGDFFSLRGDNPSCVCICRYK